ncbi:hypothetical protein [Kitasatospora sp. LaBMicrA B282]|uniref:hypothetical protein n=1 Tax=Kitasatospora sp. LaBMicrA B282 TaxID=3420949 RepID=UPI003D0A2C61
MGVLVDYFRAADAAAVVRALEASAGGSPLTETPRAFDGVEAKNLEPVVILGQLIAAIRQIHWRVDLVQETSVWPTSPKPGPDGLEDEDDPWATGPWAAELHPLVRDTLAAVRDVDLPAVVARWAQAAELRGAGAAELLPVATELVALARRAREADEQLYWWACV